MFLKKYFSLNTPGSSYKRKIKRNISKVLNTQIFLTPSKTKLKVPYLIFISPKESASEETLLSYSWGAGAPLPALDNSSFSSIMEIIPLVALYWIVNFLRKKVITFIC